MIRTQTVNIKVVVPPPKLHIYNEYIIEKVNNIEGTVYSNKCGYVESILNINSIEQTDLSIINFSGDIIYKVSFDVMCINPQPGDVFSCTVSNVDNIIYSEDNIIKTIIINESEITGIKVGDNIRVQVLVSEINKITNTIKVVGRLIGFEQ